MCEGSIHGVCERVIKRELSELARDQTQTQNYITNALKKTTIGLII